MTQKSRGAIAAARDRFPPRGIIYYFIILSFLVVNIDGGTLLAIENATQDDFLHI